MQNKAVVVGALGVIGRYIVERLIEEPDWQVVGLSRRKTSDRPHYRHIAVDLLDVEDTKRKLAELTDVTQVSMRHSKPLPGARRISPPIRAQIANVGELGQLHRSRRASSKTSRSCHWHQILRRAPWAAEDADARR